MCAALRFRNNFVSAARNALASISSQGLGGEPPGTYARAFARLENHYFTNRCFLDEETAILNRMDRLKGIPGWIVQGRYDMICPPRMAWELSAKWPTSELRMVGDAGHALSEPGISAELVRIMNRIALG